MTIVESPIDQFSVGGAVAQLLTQHSDFFAAGVGAAPLFTLPDTSIFASRIDQFSVQPGFMCAQQAGILSPRWSADEAMMVTSPSDGLSFGVRGSIATMVGTSCYYGGVIDTAIAHAARINFESPTVLLGRSAFTKTRLSALFSELYDLSHFCWSNEWRPLPDITPPARETAIVPDSNEKLQRTFVLFWALKKAFEPSQRSLAENIRYFVSSILALVIHQIRLALLGFGAWLNGLCDNRPALHFYSSGAHYQPKEAA